MAIVKVIIMIP